MSLVKQFKNLAEYNQLMNSRFYEATGQLSEEQIKADKGAFFKSLLGTLNHILVGDIIWLSRFAEASSPKNKLAYFTTIKKPSSLNQLLYADFFALQQEREKVDALIIDWINTLDDVDLSVIVKYKNINGQAFNKELSSLINHLFLHQVHHRGQASTLLTQFGVDFGETDLIEIIKNYDH